MNTAEEKLWNYIDGTCTPAEQEAIRLQLEQDTAFAAKYRELLLLNSEFSAMELDEPPMAFTYNVIEGIRNEQALQPLKAAINKRIIRGISLLFIGMLSVILIYTFSKVSLSTGGTGINLFAKFTVPNFSKYFTGPVMQIFLFLDIVLALYLADNYLRKKRITKTDISVQPGVQQNDH